MAPRAAMCLAALAVTAGVAAAAAVTGETFVQASHRHKQPLSAPTRDQIVAAWLPVCAERGGGDACCGAWATKVESHATKLQDALAETGALIQHARERQRKNPLTVEEAKRTKNSYDVAEPTWSCEAEDRVPSDTFADGPKWVCGVDHLAPAPCVVYSGGSKAMTSFENGIHSRRPDCAIYTFDPTLEPEGVVSMQKLQAQGLLTFVPEGIADTNSGFRKSFPAKTLAGHMKALGHGDRPLSLLKIDIEGSEFGVLAEAAGESCDASDPRARLPFSQLQVEVHKTNFIRIGTLFTQLAACHMAIFHKERNHWGCDGYRCVEFSLVTPEAAYESFAASHPSCGP